MELKKGVTQLTSKMSLRVAMQKEITQWGDWINRWRRTEHIRTMKTRSEEENPVGSKQWVAGGLKWSGGHLARQFPRLSGTAVSAARYTRGAHALRNYRTLLLLLKWKQQNICNSNSKTPILRFHVTDSAAKTGKSADKPRGSLYAL